MKQSAFLLTIFLLASVIFTGCEKALFETVTTFNVRLTASSEIAAEQLNVEIKSVEVSYDNNSWETLNTPGQVYNLLEFKGGADTLLAAGSLPATSVVKQMKITFGANNSVKLDGKLLPLTTANNTNTIVLTVEKKLNRIVEKVTLVIDPAASIKQTTEGGFVFAPVASIR